MVLTPDTRLGPYEIVGPLGEGGMGEVYRARDTRLGRDVAIKALPPAFAADPARLSRFRREAQTLASLNHPNIAAIYGLEEGAGAPHLVLELVEGETLATRLAHGALPQSEAMALSIQVAGAIEAAHERGIVHRDLKPGNVMINRAGVAKVLDFGLAKSDPAPTDGTLLSDSPTLSQRPEATEAGVILGTAAYMSPEQARGKPVDRRGDVWSFGCVLFECFTGRPAFAGETASDLIARILEREPDWSALPAGTPPRVREILRRCLRKNADERPRDIRDVRLELSDIASGGGKTEGREKSIAVMPFENLSGSDDEFFADGVTDEILNALAQVEGLRVAAPAEVMSKSKALAERALAIDPGLVEAWSALAAVEEQYDRNFSHSDSLYDRALKLEPRNATTRAQWALWRVIRGAMPDEEGLVQLRRAVQDDPLNAWVGAMLSYCLGIVGRHEESSVEAERSMGLDAESFFARWNLMRAHAWAGDYDRAIEEAPTLLGDSGRHHWALGLLAWTYSRAGRTDRARACYDELEGRSRHEFVSPCWLSVTAGCADLEDPAVHWAERAVAESDPLLLWSRRLPFWEYHRARPRFKEVMRGVWE